MQLRDLPVAARRPRILALLLVAGLLAAQPITGGRARERADVTQRARARWVVSTDRGKAVYFANGRRDADPDSTRPAIGFVGVKRCVRSRTCIGASFGKKIPTDSFVVDPGLSEARLRLRAPGGVQAATWDAEEGRPEIDIDPPMSGDSGMTTTRPADSWGDIFGRSLPAPASTEATELEQGVDSDGAPTATSAATVTLADTTRVSDRDAAAATTSARLVAASSGSGSCYRFMDADRQFTRLMNDARAGSGRRRLRLDPHASRAARLHAAEMDSRSTLYHTPSRTLGRRITRWRILGENVGVGGGVKALHHAFMHSPTHRRNILYGKYRHVGVGVRRDGARLWVTVIFEARRDPGTRLSMPSC